MAGITSWQPSATAATVTSRLVPSGDAYVSGAKPRGNFGSADTLRTEALRQPKRSYLKFDLTQLSGTVVKATLRLYARRADGVGYTIQSVASNSWTEDTITHATAPPPGPAVARSGPVARDTWTTVDVTSLVRTNATISLALSPTGTSSGRYGSRESGATAPRLVVEATTSSAVGTSMSAASSSAMGATTTSASMTASSSATSTTRPTTTAPRETTTTSTTTTTPSPPPSGAAPVPLGVPGSWTLDFRDEFSGTSLDLAKWTPLPGRRMNNVTASTSNVAVSGGNLILTLASSTSGAFISSNPRDGAGVGYLFPVGAYAEARVRFPGDGRAIYNWPAWWISGPNWPNAGEHDIAEGLGTLTVNYHSPSGAHNQGSIPGTWSNEFHTYGVHRKASSADVYWDGVLVESYPTDDNGAAQSLLVNVGSHSSGGNVFGSAGQLRVDYVRVWRRA
jgi:hypothetical protein